MGPQIGAQIRKKTRCENGIPPNFPPGALKQVTCSKITCKKTEKNGKVQKSEVQVHRGNANTPRCLRPGADFGAGGGDLGGVPVIQTWYQA